MILIKNTIIILLLIYLSACSSSENSEITQGTQQVFTSISNTSVYNKGAYVTSMCYTKTTDDFNNTYNPCFACHINSSQPNYVDDFALQENYDFSDYTLKNRFTNLFIDRTQEVANISDEEILTYIKKSNYIDNNNKIYLANILKNPPKEWDINEDNSWNGYTPDCYFNFNSDGFDINPQGEYTFWRAFAYYPFLGSFWPTNGSTDDVMIRLPEAFYMDDSNKIDMKIYKLNLAIVESLIKKEDISINAVDENIYGVDLNQNGTLDIASKVVYKWKIPMYSVNTKLYYDYSMYYVGKANTLQTIGKINMAPGLYPKDVEFLHSVRYIDVNEDSTIGLSSRMKELRYAKKTSYNTYPQLQNATLSEIKEKYDFPQRLRTIYGDAETGLSTGLGWVYQGFIEDKDGFLRPQTYEENLNCIGCHSGIGSIVDSTFVFPRKLDFDTFQNGWYHYSQHSHKDIKEPLLKDGSSEYLEYLKVNPYGDEFRTNAELYEKFHEEDGTLNLEEVEKFKNDISYLLYPSTSRALELNKAYKIIVNEQSYIYGRVGHTKPLVNVYQELNATKSTKLKAIKKVY